MLKTKVRFTSLQYDCHTKRCTYLICVDWWGWRSSLLGDWTLWIWTMYWKALSKGTMSWYTAFGGECIEGSVDNEWAGAWGRQKGRQWGHITQLRARGRGGEQEADLRHVGTKLAGLWSGQKEVRERRAKQTVGIPKVTVHGIQRRWEAWGRTKEIQLEFFFLINWLACWLGSGVSLKCPWGSGTVPSWRLLGAGGNTQEVVSREVWSH